MKSLKKKRISVKKYIIIAFWAVLLCFEAILVQSENTERALCYTALGDSIPKGYCAEEDLKVVSYPQLIADDMQTVGKKPDKSYTTMPEMG